MLCDVCPAGLQCSSTHAKRLNLGGATLAPQPISDRECGCKIILVGYDQHSLEHASQRLAVTQFGDHGHAAVAVQSAEAFIDDDGVKRLGRVAGALAYGQGERHGYPKPLSAGQIADRDRFRAVSAAHREIERSGTLGVRWL